MTPCRCASSCLAFRKIVAPSYSGSSGPPISMASRNVGNYSSKDTASHIPDGFNRHLSSASQKPISNHMDPYRTLTFHLNVQRVLVCLEKKNQLDAIEWFIALIICSTCFGHLYAHHQELKSICVLLPPVVCNAFVAGGRRSGEE